MTLDLDALEVLEKKATQGVAFSYNDFRNVFNALPELIRLARIGQRVEREVVQIGLCEIRNLTLKADTLYRFKKMHQCVSCQKYEDGK